MDVDAEHTECIICLTHDGPKRDNTLNYPMQPLSYIYKCQCKAPIHNICLFHYKNIICPQCKTANPLITQDVLIYPLKCTYFFYPNTPEDFHIITGLLLLWITFKPSRIKLVRDILVVLLNFIRYSNFALIIIISAHTLNIIQIPIQIWAKPILLYESIFFALQIIYHKIVYLCDIANKFWLYRELN